MAAEAPRISGQERFADGRSRGAVQERTILVVVLAPDGQRDVHRRNAGCPRAQTPRSTSRGDRHRVDVDVLGAGEHSAAHYLGALEWRPICRRALDDARLQLDALPRVPGVAPDCRWFRGQRVDRRETTSRASDGHGACTSGGPGSGRRGPTRDPGSTRRLAGPPDDT